MNDNTTFSLKEMIILAINNPYLAFGHQMLGNDNYFYFDGKIFKNQNNLKFTTNVSDLLSSYTASYWKEGWFTIPHIKIAKG